MKIMINNNKLLDVTEKCLVVKNNKLFNVSTNEYEAIDGDSVEFITQDNRGEQFVLRGTVKGYTCNRRIELKGSSCLYAMVNGTGKNITHLSSITWSNCHHIEAEPEKDLELEFAEMAL